MAGSTADSSVCGFVVSAHTILSNCFFPTATDTPLLELRDKARARGGQRTRSVLKGHANGIVDQRTRGDAKPLLSESSQLTAPAIATRPGREKDYSGLIAISFST